MQPRVGVGVFIFKDGAFLMGKRVGTHGKGTWSVPGGWIEYGETYAQASVREVKEETGIEVGLVTFGAITDNIFEDEAVHSLTVWTTCGWKAGEPTILEPEKFVEQAWFDFDSLPEPLFLPWQQLLTSDFMSGLRSALEKSKNC